jgi:transketolase
LKSLALSVRRDIVKMIAGAGSGHPGGSLSEVELLVALYNGVLRHRPDQPDWAERDRFVLSKGHGAPGLYAVLAQCGYFPREWLFSLRKMGAPLQGHTDKRFLPVLEASTGSLGQGLSIGVGMALAARLDGSARRTCVLIGDGESQEGQVWEAAAAAAKFALDNLCGVTDCNGFQLDGALAEIMPLEPLAQKWRAFGWLTLEIDGHSFPDIFRAFEEASTTKGKPTMILARTVKGKGVSFMEHNNDFHGRAPTPDELTQALAELTA